MSPYAEALRYFETLRHLRVSQIANRIVRRFRRREIDMRPAPPMRARIGKWVRPLDHLVRLDGPHSLTLINRPGKVFDAAGWNDPAQPKLWLYNLHYFDWLVGARSPDQRDWERGLIVRWVAENPVGHGNGWEPYPLSLRITNWVKWLLEGNKPPSGMVDSLAHQLRFLECSIEWHLLGNHLLANAKALFMGGAFFGGTEGDHWRDRGNRLLRDQWRRQILGDGGHEERSAMYHALLLEDVLDCLNAAHAFGLATSGALNSRPQLAGQMLAWLSAMTHPDGSIAQFNDAAPGVAATLHELADYAKRLGTDEQPPVPHGIIDLPATGYLRAQAGDALLLIDAGQVGPGHQPGHAHADTLGFELSIGRTPVLVSAGTSTYEAGPQRSWERSSSAHNCVVVDGRDSSDVWAAFRTGRRARVIERVASAGPPHTIAAAHDGYRFLPGSPIVRRIWSLHAGQLMVEDDVSVADLPCTAWLHLGRDVEVEVDGATARLTWPGGRAELIASASLFTRRTSRALGFNRTIGATSLSYELARGKGHFGISW